MCNIEVIKGHKIGFFTEDGGNVEYVPTGVKAFGTYLYKTVCGTFTAVAAKNAFLIMEADKIRVTPV